MEKLQLLNMASRTKIYEAFLSAEYRILLCTDIAARGLDIPDVDLVVQFDAPQDPQAFVHRSGRTGRSGRKGRALLFVQPNEDAYITYLARKSVPLSILEVELTTKTYPTIRFIEQVKSDHDLYDRSVLAFVSYLRSYSKHELSYIFRVDQLQMDELVKGYFLLRAPKCPELKESDINGVADAQYIEQMDVLLEYRDPVQEAARLLQLSVPKPEPIVRKRKSEDTGSWSKVRDKVAAKEKRAEKASCKRIAEMEKRLEEEASQAELDDDWAEMCKGKKTEKAMSKVDDSGDV
jgi:ATP-dependent RNA helicase DDX55/SPB4